MKKIFTFLLISLILTGCVQYSITINLQKTKSASLESNLLIKTELLKSSQITINSLKKQLTDNDFFKDWQIKKTTKTINHAKYQGLKIIAPKTINQQLNKNLKTQKKQKLTTYTFNFDLKDYNLDLSELKDYQNTLTVLKSSQATFVLKIIMPGKIAKTNVGTINNNTVSIDLFPYLIKGKIPALKIVSKDNETFSSYYLLIVFLIFIIICYLIKKKKAK